MALNLPLRRQRGTVTKLEPLWVGPFKILAVVSDRTYRVDLPSTMRINPVIDISRLRPAILPVSTEWPDRSKLTRPPAVADDELGPSFEVEAILDRRTYRGKVQYLVHWKGYPVTDASWVSEADIDAPDAMDQYNRRSAIATATAKKKTTPTTTRRRSNRHRLGVQRLVDI
jgi:hypothetical protein